GPAKAEQVNKSLKQQNLAPQATPTAYQPATQQEEVNEKLLASTKKIKCKVKKVILTGNHVYSTAQLEVFYKDKINQTISVFDLFVILQNITNYYRNNGYILTRAILPEQKVTNGEVHLQIIEGYIGKVTITGKPHRAA